MLGLLVGEVCQPLDHDVLIGAAARGDDRVGGVEPVGRNLRVQSAEPVKVGSDGRQTCGLAVVTQCSLVTADAGQREPRRTVDRRATARAESIVRAPVRPPGPPSSTIRLTGCSCGVDARTRSISSTVCTLSAQPKNSNDGSASNSAASHASAAGSTMALASMIRLTPKDRASCTCHGVASRFPTLRRRAVEPTPAAPSSSCRAAPAKPPPTGPNRPSPTHSNRARPCRRSAMASTSRRGSAGCAGNRGPSCPTPGGEGPCAAGRAPGRRGRPRRLCRSRAVLLALRLCNRYCVYMLIAASLQQMTVIASTQRRLM